MLQPAVIGAGLEQHYEFVRLDPERRNQSQIRRRRHQKEILSRQSTRRYLRLTSNYVMRIIILKGQFTPGTKSVRYIHLE